MAKPMLMPKLISEGKATKIKQGDIIYFDKTSLCIVLLRSAKRNNRIFLDDDDKIFVGTELDNGAMQAIVSLVAAASGLGFTLLPKKEWNTFPCEFC